MDEVSKWNNNNSNGRHQFIYICFVRSLFSLFFHWCQTGFIVELDTSVCSFSLVFCRAFDRWIENAFDKIFQLFCLSSAFFRWNCSHLLTALLKHRQFLFNGSLHDALLPSYSNNVHVSGKSEKLSSIEWDKLIFC